MERSRSSIVERRTHLYCIGAAKSGTQSIADCFTERLRSVHEPEANETIDAILAVAEGAMSRAALGDYVRERDRRLALEVDSSQLNYFLLDDLVSVFPEARFVLTIRDPYSWLDSLINHQLNRTVTARWKRLRELRFRARELKHPAEESPLRQRGLYTLDGYLSYWRVHNHKVLSSVPPQKLLVVRTNEITQRLGEIARFAGIDADSVDASRSHSNKGETKHGVLAELDPHYLAAKVDRCCGRLVQEYFPDVATPRPARAAALRF